MKDDHPVVNDRISVLGIEGICQDHQNYFSRGVAKAAMMDVCPRANACEYVWLLFTCRETLKSEVSPTKQNIDALNSLLEKHDLYLTRLQLTNEHMNPLIGELYARKVVPDRINVIDIEVKEARP